MIDKHTQFFRYHSCVFRVASGKQSTARAVLIRTFGVAFTYTVEASNGLYHCPEKLKDVAFTQMHWIEMGAKIFDALESYYKMLLEFEEIKLQKRLEK